MLQAIRSKASSLIVKVLFGVLVISFGVWGIGDIFRNRGADTTVATVGGRKIDQRELTRAVNEQAEQLRAMLRGARPDAEQLKALGIVDSALERLINRELMDLEIGRLRLAVSDEAIRQAIVSTRAFQNDTGQFDRDRYRAVLAAQHLSEPQFEALLRADLIRQQLGHAVADGVVPPAGLVDALYRNRAERRVADIAILPESAAAAPDKPSDAELSAFYEQHKSSFALPELRSFSVGVLSLDDVAAGIEVPESKLREEYEARLADFRTPEQRHLQQILLPDEAKAKEAESQLAAGKDFAAVAKDVSGATPDLFDLGLFKRDDLPLKLADAAFDIKKGEVTPPIEDELGWHILRVTEIKPEVTQPFAEAKQKLAADISRDLAGDEIAKRANQIDDAVAAETPFADVAARFGLKVTKVESVGRDGHKRDGSEVELPPPADQILDTAFHSAEGKTSPLTEMGESGYYLVQVDKVTPSTFKPLDEVRAQATELWQADKRNAALETLAKEMTDAVNAGQKLADVAAAHKLPAFTSAPLLRSGGDTKVPPAITAKIFESKPGAAAFARGADGYVVAQVKEVLPPDPAKEGEAVARVSQQLAPAMREELLQQFEAALRERYPVTIDNEAVARAF
ncbi:MAG TPA: peptidyl-prolyl cis-trans isomerase [Stellaceae bacterium]